MPVLIKLASANFWIEKWYHCTSNNIIKTNNEWYEHSFMKVLSTRDWRRIYPFNVNIKGLTFISKHLVTSVVLDWLVIIYTGTLTLPLQRNTKFEHQQQDSSHVGSDPDPITKGLEEVNGGFTSRSRASLVTEHWWGQLVLISLFRHQCDPQTLLHCLPGPVWGSPWTTWKEKPSFLFCD